MLKPLYFLLKKLDEKISLIIIIINGSMDLNENQIKEPIKFIFKNQPQKINVWIFKSPKLVNSHKFIFLFFEIHRFFGNKILRNSKPIDFMYYYYFHLLENDNSLKNKKTIQQIGHNMCF